MLYYKYSDYLKNKYGEKVYKLPVNLPVTCQQIYCIFSELYQYLSSSGQISQLSDGGYQDSGCRGDICFHKTGLCFG